MPTTTRDALRAAVRRDRQRFDAVLEQIPHEALSDPVLPGGWSVKDVLAHIAWGEREAIGVISSRALVGSALWELDEDSRNDAVVTASRSRTIDEVVEDYRATFAEFTTALDELSDDELNEPDRFRGLRERIPGWRPWRVLYDPDHYEDHATTLEAALPAFRPQVDSRTLTE